MKKCRLSGLRKLFQTDSYHVPQSGFDWEVHDQGHLQLEVDCQYNEPKSEKVCYRSQPKVELLFGNEQKSSEPV